MFLNKATSIFCKSTFPTECRYCIFANLQEAFQERYQFQKEKKELENYYQFLYRLYFNI